MRNIVFLISEVEDIIKTGGLADVGKALPIALQKAGHKVTVVMPFYKAIANKFALSDALPNQSLYVDEQHYAFAVKHLLFENIDVYFIDYPKYFGAEDLYASNINAERFCFFSQAALVAIESLQIPTEVLHCHDWHAAMACYFIRANQQLQAHFQQTKTVLTIHNAAFQGVAAIQEIPSLGHYTLPLYTDNGHLNMLKTGILYADEVTTVSPTYADELATVLGSHGIHDAVQHRRKAVKGILNGCDYQQWDPFTDTMIAQNYHHNDLSGKQICKASLQQSFNLPVDSSVPVIGMVCRATLQKGFAYLLPIIPELLQHKVQLVIVGTGQPDITQALRDLSQSHPQQFAFIEEFKPEYAHYVEAGADFFLMPSEFEPCGLNQMYSLAYGTLPIVRAVGGLGDTVTDIEYADGTGVVFHEPSPAALLSAIRKALLFWHATPEAYQAAQKRGMQQRFTWQDAAREYEKLYSVI